MTPISRTGGTAQGVARVLAFLLLGLSLLTGPPSQAHEGEGTGAREAVLQAIAYLVSSPDDMDAVEERIADAHEAEDTSGVDLTLVGRAESALVDGDMVLARALLQRAVGAGTDMTGVDMRPILQVPPGAATVPLATGEATGTSVVTDEMAGREGLTRTDLGLLGIATGVVLAGLWLSHRYRPAHSIHRLVRAAAR